MGEVAGQAPPEGQDLKSIVDKALNDLSGTVYDSVKVNVLDKFRLDTISFKPDDFEGGKLKDDVIKKLKDDLKLKVKDADYTAVMAAAEMNASFDVSEVSAFFVERAVENLGKKIEEDLKEFESFTVVNVTPKDLLQFDVKVDGVKKIVAGKDDEKPVKDANDLNQIELNEQLASEKEEKAKLKTALGKAGILGWIASKFLFQERKDKDGKVLPSYIDEAYKDPDSMYGAVLNLFGVEGKFKGSWANTTKDLPKEMQTFVDSINKTVAPHKQKVVDALGGVVEGRTLDFAGFMEGLKSEEFKKGLGEEFVLKGAIDFMSGVHNGKKIMVNLNRGALKIPTGVKFAVKPSPDEGFTSRLAGGEKFEEVKEMSDGVLYIGELPAGTIFPKGATIQEISA